MEFRSFPNEEDATMTHAKHTHRRTTQRKDLRSKPEPGRQRRRVPHHVALVDRFDSADPDNEFVHDDDWLYPYEPEP